VFAKLGSDYKKPDATTVITRKNFKDIIWPLPVGTLLYVGKVAADILARHRVYTIGELASYNKEHISYLLGKTGELILNYANGIDESPVAQVGEGRELKSVGNGMTFKRNLTSLPDIKLGVKVLADSVATRLRTHGLKCSTIQVIIKDPQFKSISRQRKLIRPTNLTKEISDVAVDIILSSWKIDVPIRMLTITGLQPVNEHEAAEQLIMFEDSKSKESERQEKLERIIDNIRQKYGWSAISMGVIPEDNDLGIDTGYNSEEK
jgi:DNA polymerase IV